MENPPPGALVLEVGTDVFSAIPWLETVPWVLAIDTMESGGAPGTLYVCDGADIATPALPKSLHELGLLSVLEFIPEKRRPEVSVLGVQPAEIDYGLFENQTGLHNISLKKSDVMPGLPILRIPLKG